MPILDKTIYKNVFVPYIIVTKGYYRLASYQLKNYCALMTNIDIFSLKFQEPT